MSGWLWVAVALLSTVPLGSYFLFDLLGAIGTGSGATWQHRFHQHDREFTQTMSGLLYSVYSWPNVFLAMIGGVLVDNVLGVQRSALLFTLLVLLGAWITYLGVVHTSFDLLLVGRVVLGFGGETQLVAQYSFIGNWFDGRPGAGMAFGIVAAVQRLGAGATFWLGPRVAASSGVLDATFMAVAVSAACVGTLMATIVLHRRVSARPDGAPVTDEGVFKNMKSAVTAPILTLALANGLVSMALYGFAAIAVRLLEITGKMSPEAAGSAVTGFYVVVVIAAPLLGNVIERVGNQLSWLVMASLCAGALTLAFAHGLLPGYLYCGALAVPQAIVLSAVYPIVSRYVRVECEGFAFGVLVSVQNAGLAVATVVNGLVLDSGNGSTSDRYTAILHGEVVLYILSGVAFFALGLMTPLPPVGEREPLIITEGTSMQHNDEEAELQEA
jgi:MFS family permease